MKLKKGDLVKVLLTGWDSAYGIVVEVGRRWGAVDVFLLEYIPHTYASYNERSPGIYCFCEPNLEKI